MKDKNVLHNRRFLGSLALLLLLIFFVFAALQSYSGLKDNLRNYHANSLDTLDQRFSSVLVEINNFPRSAGNDILFLSRLSSLKRVVENRYDLKDLKSDFLEFSKENTAYYQLRYIDQFGKEVVRVNFDEGVYQIIPEDELQDKEERYYFNEAMKINNGEVYISRLDLNVEEGEIENHGTEENPVYVPMIRYATPVFDKDGEKKGIIVSNVYADYFLEDIRRSQREGEEIILIDQEGYYLAHSNRSKEYGFMFENSAGNFFEDYPLLVEKLLVEGRERVETENAIFSFRFIYPTVTSFEVHKGSERILGENPEGRYFWIAISISDKFVMENVDHTLRKNYLYSLFFYGLFVVAIFILMFFIGFWDDKRARERHRSVYPKLRCKGARKGA
ncbi:cache domain-containing protein [archaeon]|jgi:hypothetical protein|nr:cache domain-containing protein [archaeon]